MELLDPRKTLAALRSQFPAALLKKAVVVGSLAAALSFRSRLKSRGITTKDADLLIQSTGGTAQARRLMESLLTRGWTRSAWPGKECFPMAPGTPPERCRAIRLLPPKSGEYYLEVLGLPTLDQSRPLVWKAVEARDGRYALPCFRFMGLGVEGAPAHESGFRHAAPAMMALANLLSHPDLGTQRVKDETGKPRELRAAKDLGRALSLWFLSNEEERKTWAGLWIRGLRRRFPRTWKTLAPGRGLRALTSDRAALIEAHRLSVRGLLDGFDVRPEEMRVLAEELLDGPVKATASASGG